MKFKNNGKFGNKGRFPSSGKDKKDFKRKDGKESQSTQGVTCFECNEHGHFKKECPNYLRMKGRVYATTLSDSDSSNSDLKESCDREENYFVFMTIDHVESSKDLSLLVIIIKLRAYMTGPLPIRNWDQYMKDINDS